MVKIENFLVIGWEKAREEENRTYIIEQGKSVEDVVRRLIQQKQMCEAEYALPESEARKINLVNSSTQQEALYLLCGKAEEKRYFRGVEAANPLEAITIICQDEALKASKEGIEYVFLQEQLTTHKVDI